MEASLAPLLPLLARERAAARPFALGVLLETAGSTYRKAGALMAMTAGGEFAGLLSGGCLEGDLGEHARSVITSGTARVVTYDTRGPDDLVWGLGLGCEGAMRILLLRVGPEQGYEPLEHLARALADHRATAVGVITESRRADVPLGGIVLPDGGGTGALRGEAVQGALAQARDTGKIRWLSDQNGEWQLFLLPIALPPRLLLLGAGPDAVPVVDFAARLGWKVTVVDHRPVYATSLRFARAERVVPAPSPAALSEVVDLEAFDATVVMSHHLASDLAYLRTLAHAGIPYVGLLGPAARREKLLEGLNGEADRLRPRLHAPVGLPLGGRAPESIALAIVAEIHAFLNRSAV